VRTESVCLGSHEEMNAVKMDVWSTFISILTGCRTSLCAPLHRFHG